MPKRNVVWIAAIVAAAAVVMWFTRSAPPPVSEPGRDEYRSVAWTARKIQDEYGQPVEPAELRQAAVRGMVESLDEFSRYLDPDQAEMIERRMRGQQVGLGLRIELDAAGRVSVLGPLYNSPAHRAGVYCGYVLSIDDLPVAGLTRAEVEDMLAGPVGTTAKLTIEDGSGDERTVRLTRQAFAVEAVQGFCRDRAGRWIWMVAPQARIAYLRITEFVPAVGEQFVQAVRSLDPAAGIVLDLRSNPGGLLGSAVEVANLFLRAGTIVTVKDRAGREEAHRASAEGTYSRQIPIVVLIDSQTSSAAEIVAGALGSAGRAVLVGTRTRGKGCVQTTFDLPGGLGKMHLTTAEYFLGESQPIARVPGSESWGVAPHVPAELTQQEQRRLAELRRRAELMPPPSAGGPTTVPADGEPSELVLGMLATDGQLAQALELLDSPERMEAILTRAARQAAEATQPAGAGQDDE